ncbi:hypothetical protein CLU79DRAFT_739696, partial [Phycomyces nitens]
MMIYVYMYMYFTKALQPILIGLWFCYTVSVLTANEVRTTSAPRDRLCDMIRSGYVMLLYLPSNGERCVALGGRETLICVKCSAGFCR